MRRLAVILLCVIALLSMTCGVHAAQTYASRATVYVTVNADESATVTATVMLHISENTGDLTFPVPENATAITLGGSRANVSRAQQCQQVALSGLLGQMTGELSFTVGYTLPDVIGVDAAGQKQLQLPLLSGFSGSVSSLEFTVTMPAAISNKPAFTSGYHQANIEKDLTVTTQGNTVIGVSVAELKDHETLNMTLQVDEQMFPSSPLELADSSVDDVLMVVFGVLAIAYWLIFLRRWPVSRTESTTPPEGVSAGQLGAMLTLQRPSLCLMVLSWAQLGYLQILRQRGRVYLVRQMEMGNERSDMEQKIFKTLFRKSERVDTAGVRFAELCTTVARIRPRYPSNVDPKSGNSMIFRVLAAMVAAFGGVSFAVAVTQGAALQGFWIVVMGLIGLLGGLWMQQCLREIWLRKTYLTWAGLLCTGIYLLLGAVSGQLGIAVAVAASQLLAGYMAFYGVRRTQAGRQEIARILGLRRHLCRISRQELERICENDPTYFSAMLPYALALGVDRRFARRFSRENKPECPYLEGERRQTALQWSEEIRYTLKSMEKRANHLFLERLTGRK